MIEANLSKQTGRRLNFRSLTELAWRLNFDGRLVDVAKNSTRTNADSIPGLRNGSGGALSEGLRRSTIESKSAGLRLSDLNQSGSRKVSSFSNDGKTGQLDPGARKDIAEKITGPVQRGLGIKDGIKTIIIGTGKITDQKAIKNGDGSTQTDRTGKANGKTPESAIKAAIIDDLRARVVQLPAEIKEGAAKLAARLIKNPKEEIGGKDKELVDAMRQLTRAELKILQLILKNGAKPDFSQFRPEAQNALILIFKIMLAQDKNTSSQLVNDNKRSFDTAGGANTGAGAKGDTIVSQSGSCNSIRAAAGNDSRQEKTDATVKLDQTKLLPPVAKSDDNLQANQAMTEAISLKLPSEEPGGIDVNNGAAEEKSDENDELEQFDTVKIHLPNQYLLLSYELYTGTSFLTTCRFRAKTAATGWNVINVD